MTATDGINASGNAIRTGELPIQLVSADTRDIASGDGPDVLHVASPPPGVRENVVVHPGQEVVLDGVNLSTARIERMEGGLLITLAEGGVIFLAAFADAASSAHPPHIEIPGLGSIDAGQLLAAAGNSISRIQPAAGPGDPAHGGSSFGDIVQDGIGDGFGRLGLLSPDQFPPPNPQFAYTTAPIPGPTPAPHSEFAISVTTTPTPGATVPPPTIAIGSPIAMAVDESHLTVGTNGIAGSAPNLALTHETADYSAAFTIAGGSTSYALGVPGGDGANSGLTDSQTGSAIVLALNGGTVEGHVGSVGGALAFTLAVDPATGAVTLTQDRAIAQADGTSANDGVTIPAGVVTLAATVTGPGGVATALVDVGHQVSFLDDGPTIALSGAVPTLSVDESNLPTGAAANAALTHAMANFSGAFTAATGGDGGSTTYALSITGGNGTASGLTDSLTGQSIVLVNNAGIVEGHVGNSGGALAFTIGVDAAAGDVTLTEMRAVKEGDSSSANESITLNANVVALTATVTDSDGDSASSAIDLGSKMTFLDDGPTIAPSGAAAPTLSVDESNLASGTAPNAALTHATANFAGAFTPVTGADGGSTAYSLSIAGGNGTASGLTDSLTNQSVVLVNNAGTIEGHVGTTGGALAFTIGADAATGDVTLTELRAVKESNAASNNESITLTSNVVSLTATVTDNDGDSASSTIDVGAKMTFLDDGPSIGLSGNAPTLLLDESYLPLGITPTPASTATTANFAGAFTVTGADGGTAAYQVSAVNGTDSGLIDSATAHHVYLFNESGVVVGREGASSSAAATGNQVFTLSVDGSTGDVTMTELRAVHESNTSSGNETITMNAHLVTLTATVTDNDGDTATQTLDLGSQVTFRDDAPTFSHIENGMIGDVAGATVHGTHNLAFGADGESAINITPLTAITGVSYDPVVHNADGSSTLTAKANGAEVYHLTVGADGTYDFAWTGGTVPVTSTYSLASVNGGGTMSQFTLGDATFKSVDTNNNHSFDNSELFNSAANGLGLQNNNIKSGEQFSVTFANPTDSMSFDTKVQGNGTVKFTWVAYEDGVQVETGTTNSLSANGTISLNPTHDFNSITFTAVTTGSAAAKFTGVTFTEDVSLANRDYQFQIGGVDGDGDTSSQTLDVQVLSGHTLVLSGGQDPDFTQLVLNSVNTMDMKTDSGANTVTLNFNDVLQADNHTLTIAGGANDIVDAGSGWTHSPSQVTISGVQYDVYTQSAGGQTATLQIEHQVNQAHVQV